VYADKRDYLINLSRYRALERIDRVTMRRRDGDFAFENREG